MLIIGYPCKGLVGKEGSARLSNESLFRQKVYLEKIIKVGRASGWPAGRCTPGSVEDTEKHEVSIHNGNEVGNKISISHNKNFNILANTDSDKQYTCQAIYGKIWQRAGGKPGFLWRGDEGD